jgi:hypothetical protein
MKSLCRAIIWTTCFLEMSEADVVDPDAAIKVLEDLADTMQGATNEEKRAFIATCADEADRLQRDDFPPYRKTAEFIRSLPQSLGL